MKIAYFNNSDEYIIRAVGSDNGTVSYTHAKTEDNVEYTVSGFEKVLVNQGSVIETNTKQNEFTVDQEGDGVIDIETEQADKEKVFVQFDYQDGKMITIAYADENGNVVLPKEPERNGNKFLGWYTEPDGAGNKFAEDTIVSKSITVYAKWITEDINPFSDIAESSWQYASAKYAYDNGLMAGKGQDENGNIIFDPNKSIPREEFVQVLYNASGKPAVDIENKFPDVKDAWYKNAVLWANANDIANGKGNGDFGVTESISRQDLALMLYKYARMNGYDLTANTGEINKYADGNKVSSYAKTAMDWAITKGVMSGKGKKGEDISTFKLDPAGTATRAECAAMLKNFMEAYGK